MMDQRARRRVIIAIVSAAMLGCGDGNGGGGGNGTSATAVSDLTVTPTYDSPDPLGVRPATIEMSLILDPDGTGVLGTQPLSAELAVSSASITWTASGNSIEIAPGSVSIAPQASLSWTSFLLTLTDADGDGVRESGSGSLSGQWEIVVTDIVDTAGVQADVDAFADRQFPVLTFEIDNDTPSPIVPVRSFPVSFSEPLMVEDVQREVTVLVDGEQFTVSMSATTPGKYATSVNVTPGEPLPFDSILTLDVGALRDRAGRPAQWDNTGIFVIPDAGPLTSNPGFESASPPGWVGESITGTFATVEPAEGSKQAAVVSVSRLVGYLDVPAGASQLVFSAAVLAEEAFGVFDNVASVSLETLDTSVKVFDAGSRSEDFAACPSCSAFGYADLAPYADVTADLSAFRGQRVFVVADVGFGFTVDQVEVVLLLDDFRVE